MYKNGPNDIYCFICGEKYRLEKIKSHINLCKNLYETKNHVNITINYQNLLQLKKEPKAKDQERVNVRYVEQNLLFLLGKFILKVVEIKKLKVNNIYLKNTGKMLIILLKILRKDQKEEIQK